jgi:hypothetical protein
MNDALQFLAAHRMILWIVLWFGVVGLIQVTFFHRTMVGLFDRLLDTRVVQDACERNRFWESYRRFTRRMLWSKWMRLLGTVQSLVLAGLGLAGLVLL